jgi:hypothetical protein
MVNTKSNVSQTFSSMQLFALIFQVSGASHCAVDIIEKIENDDFSSQLRSLRLLLGKNFRPISTEGLAELTSIPLLAIRAVEAGRRVLNDDDRDAIDVSLGARWDPETHQWICAQNPHFQFSRIHYMSYLKHHKAGRLSDLRQKEPLYEAIGILLSSLDAQAAVLEICKLHRQIQEHAVLNNVPPNPLERIQSLFPIPESKSAGLPAKDKAAIMKALADVEEAPTPATKNKTTRK